MACELYERFPMTFDFSVLDLCLEKICFQHYFRCALSYYSRDFAIKFRAYSGKAPVYSMTLRCLQNGEHLMRKFKKGEECEERLSGPVQKSDSVWSLDDIRYLLRNRPPTPNQQLIHPPKFYFGTSWPICAHFNEHQ